MAEQQVQVHGLAELERKLKALPAEISGKGATGPLAAALREAISVIRDDAKARAPQGETGRLKRAIKIARDRNPKSTKGSPTELYHLGVDPGRKRNDPRGAWWWWFVEAGTKKMAARPYLRPAFDLRKDEAIRRFSQRLARRIELIEKKLASQ